MKIFISWSGQHSLGVATALKEWLPLLFPDIKLFVSSEDIRKGKRWAAEVSKELESSHFGIVCLTPDNTEAPWLLFESGALSKSVKEASVYTLLFGGLRPTDIEGPLSHFQHTVFEKDDFFKLIQSINEAHLEAKQEGTRLKKIFEKFWDEIEGNVSKLLKAGAKPEKKRTAEDMLRELLELTGHIARQLSKTQATDEHLLKKLSDVNQVPASYQDFFKKAKTLFGDEPGGPKSAWEDLITRIAIASPFTKSFLLEAKGHFYTDSKTLSIRFAPEFEDHIGLVKNTKNINLIKKILAEMGFKDWEVIFGVEREPSNK